MKLNGITANAKVISLIKELNDNYYIAENYRNGHYLIKNKSNSYYAVFKKDYYNTFNREFNRNVEKADSLNLEAIKRAIQHDAKVLIIHESKVYEAFPNQVLNYCTKKGYLREQLKGNYYLKKDYSGDKAKTHETTFSFPLEPAEKSVFGEFEI